jgi:integrase
MVVPPALRATIGRSELFVSLNTKDPAEAARRYPDALAGLQARLAEARLISSGQAVSIPEDRLVALVGEHYREAAAKADARPGTHADADLGRDLVLDEMAPGDPEEDVPPEFIPSPKRLAEARRHIISQGLLPDDDSVRRMAQHLWTARYRLALRRLQRARGDYGSDPHEGAYPLPQPAGTGSRVSAPPTITMDRLLELHQAERQEPAKTHDKRRASLAHLKRIAGHDDPAKVDKITVRDLKAARTEGGAKPGTVAADIAMLRSLWAWAEKNGHLPDGASNPFAGMTPKGSKRHTSERQPFTDDEAARILTAARKEKGFLRWLPWLLAFTGCRLEEACGASAGDIRQQSGVWILDIHDRAEGRSLKDGQPVRMVPLHPALIAEGFLTYAQSLPPAGPLFPDLTPGRFGKRSEMATKHLGRWTRNKVGITDPAKVAGHSWRHRMKDLLRFARVPAEAADAFLGHNNPMNAGANYGRGWRGWPDELAKEVAKIASPVGMRD